MAEGKTQGTYQDEIQLKILKGQCLNIVGNAMMTATYSMKTGLDDDQVNGKIIDRASKLYLRLKEAEWHTKL